MSNYLASLEVLLRISFYLILHLMAETIVEHFVLIETDSVSIEPVECAAMNTFAISFILIKHHA